MNGYVRDKDQLFLCRICGRSPASQLAVRFRFAAQPVKSNKITTISVTAHFASFLCLLISISLPFNSFLSQYAGELSIGDHIHHFNGMIRITTTTSLASGSTNGYPAGQMTSSGSDYNGVAICAYNTFWLYEYKNPEIKGSRKRLPLFLLTRC